MPHDPYGWADQFGTNMQNQANQSSANKLNALMAVFAEEAARQRPMVNLPTDLAAKNAGLAIQEPYNIASDTRQRRYMEDEVQMKAAAGTQQNAATDVAPTDNGDGTETVMIGGKAYNIKKGQ